MKYLKLYEYYNNLEAKLAKYNIVNYTINNDGTIDVDGDVDLSFSLLGEIPFKFNKVEGNFYCFRNKLKSLEGCPNYIGGAFNCSFNELISLKGCPEYVGGDFYCSYNQLVNLKESPKHIDGDIFYCVFNNIKFIPYNIDLEKNYIFQIIQLI